VGHGPVCIPTGDRGNENKMGSLLVGFGANVQFHPPHSNAQEARLRQPEPTLYIQTVGCLLREPSGGTPDALRHIMYRTCIDNSGSQAYNIESSAHLAKRGL